VAGFAQAQCAKYRGWFAAALLMDWIAFFQCRKREFLDPARSYPGLDVPP